ncbi:cryptochrome/photolyase family protein [Rubritalea marina]|uniref:cryptochrome/photolyase family protein n=1 Tax=Rubritalea marina TaxID=361055 RepID=UPI00039C8842|nr:cryptochrome/photolyase family protein [Rubritalea marina]
MACYGIIFPHQLFSHHPLLEGELSCVLVDSSWLYEGKGQWVMNPHFQRLLLVKASVLAYVAEWQSRGRELSRVAELDGVPHDASELVVCRLYDDLLERELLEFCERRDLELRWLDSPGFVTPYNWGMEFFSDGKKPFMKTFYEAQRKRMGLLLEADGSPVGGKWSFDDANRKKLPKSALVPQEPKAIHGVEEQRWIENACQELRARGLWDRGSEDCLELRYPITHAGAIEWLEQFLEQRFLGFGTYEDALSTRGDFLYHSVLTPIMNIGLLEPGQVVDRAMTFAMDREIPLNDLEGFVRQVIGWREFTALVYECHGRWMRAQNFWGFDEEIPESVWKGETGLEPLDLVIRKVQEEGYAHHIERLMVLGSFFMMMRIKPDAVYTWFMEMFVDAYDWVMVPNVYGMSQFASGGFMVTKPYLSGSNYLKKMSDYANGSWNAVWDALFWSFLDDHRDFFAGNFRMKMMLGHLDRMGSAKLAEHHERALAFRETMRRGERWDGGYLL